MPRRDQKAIVFALLAVLCWSTVATAFKVALQHQSIFQLLWLSNAVSLALLAAILGAQRQLHHALLVWPNFGKTLLLGACNPVLYYLVLFAAYERLPAQVAQPINYTWALMLTWLSVPLLHHKVTRRDTLALMLGYGGVVIVCYSGAASGLELSLAGVLLAFFSTVIWAGYWLINTKDNRDPIPALFQNFLMALPLSYTVFLVCEPQARWHWQAVATASYVGLFEMGIAFIFWLLALRQVTRVSIIANLIFISPFLSLFFIHNLLGEPINWGTIIGLAVLVFGLVIQNTQKGQAH